MTTTNFKFICNGKEYAASYTQPAKAIGGWTVTATMPNGSLVDLYIHKPNGANWHASIDGGAPITTIHQIGCQTRSDCVRHAIETMHRKIQAENLEIVRRNAESVCSVIDNPQATYEREKTS